MINTPQMLYFEDIYGESIINMRGIMNMTHSLKKTIQPSGRKSLMLK
jgi:hypothetical protein